jgi:beta-ureidopropionase
MIRIGVGQLEPKVTEMGWNLEQLELILEKAHEESVDALVLPELANSGYVFEDLNEVRESSENIPNGPYCSKLRDWSKDDRLVIAGICEKGSDGLYNSAALFGNGQHLVTYRKIHLFSNEVDWFLPGDKIPPIISWRGFRFGAMICFDWAFPELARILALNGAQVILHPSNLVLKYCQNAMITRSIENRIFTATANRVGSERGISFTGASQITAPNGDVMVRLEDDSIELGYFDIQPELADDKMLGERNHLFKKRRIELYNRLLESV